MNNDFFKKNYPQISELYFDYVNRDEYANNPIVQYVEPLTSNAINEAFEYLKKGNEIRANDTLLNGAIIYETGGFILGFSLAMKLMRESVVEL